ncbi:MAG: 5'-methylthioadenosine/adenosylhomocysteine nucleosidase [Aerococcaceae bacterium]|nr:5'-methylthioadenosine/adenosylhomocysteine nucleosidase [Aerococcaceae bacterium]
MKIGIIGAMDEEIRLLKATLTEQQVNVHYGFEFTLGKVGQHDIVLVKSGIGKVNATMSVMLLQQFYAVDLVLNTGSAGALSPELAIGDVVIATSLSHHDVDVTAFGYVRGQMAGMPATYEPDAHYAEQLQAVCEQLELSVTRGQIVSGDEFVNADERVATIRRHFPEAVACEMESAAIAQAAYALQLPYIIVRAISDTADHDASMTFDEFVVLAGQKSAQMLLTFIEKLN